MIVGPARSAGHMAGLTGYSGRALSAMVLRAGRDPVMRPSHRERGVSLVATTAPLALPAGVH